MNEEGPNEVERTTAVDALGASSAPDCRRAMFDAATAKREGVLIRRAAAGATQAARSVFPTRAAPCAPASW